MNKDFFKKDSREVAFALLESNIVREVGNEMFSLEVNEVEIYEGFKDKASHAYKGKRGRNKVMFEEGGVLYVYLVYGIHSILNVVTDKKDYPAAVLIRGAGKFSGPGRLTKALGISTLLNRKEVGKESGLWFERNRRAGKIRMVPRVGIHYAEEWKEASLRFIKE